MAKRYTRINWQNNASTPINPTFLNRMDKGIKDNDDAIGDLEQLNTTSKDNLVSAINSINNSLSNKMSNKTGSFVFPATNKTGLQTVDVSFGETLSTKPSVILLQLTDSSNTISFIENPVVLRNSISTTGFSACANRLNASYNWYCYYIAFY